MFKKLRAWLTWDSNYDFSWRQFLEALPNSPDRWDWARRLAEKRAYWRERGKHNKMNAHEAAYSGMLEFSDELYIKFHHIRKKHEILIRFAKNLRSAKGWCYEGGPYVAPEDRLPDRWKVLYREYDDRRKKEEAESRPSDSTYSGRG